MNVEEDRDWGYYSAVKSYTAHLDEVLDTAVVKDGDEIVFYDGEYVRLTNCTAELLEATENETAAKRPVSNVDGSKKYDVIESRRL